MTDEDVVALREGAVLANSNREREEISHSLAGQTGAPALQLNPASALDKACLEFIAAEPGPAGPLRCGASSSV